MRLYSISSLWQCRYGVRRRRNRKTRKMVILDGWDIAIAKALAGIYEQEKKENHMYVLVVRGYRQLTTIYRYRQQMAT